VVSSADDTAPQPRCPPIPSARQSLIELKAILQNRALHFPDYTKPFFLYVDASHQYGFGLALHQNRDRPDGSVEEVPIWFDSRSLSPAERSYWPTELETAAACWALTCTRRYLDSSPRPHILFTDHKAVTSIADAKHFNSTPATRNPRLQRWALLLADQLPKLDIRHRKGIYMAHVDAPSRIQQAELQAAAAFALADPRDSDPNCLAVDGEPPDPTTQDLIISPALLDVIRASQAESPPFARLIADLHEASGGSRPFVRAPYGLDDKGFLHSVAFGKWRICIGPTVCDRFIALAHHGHLL
jgi:hypothetical protein